MARLLFGMVLLVAIFSQAAVIPALLPWGIIPNTVLVLLFIWAGWCGPREAIFWIFVSGILLDTISMDTLGTNVLALIPVVLFAMVAKEYIFHSAAFIPAMLMMLTTIVSGLILCVAHGNQPGAFLLVQSVMHGLLVLMLFPLVARAARDVRRY